MDRFYQEFLRSGIGLGPLGLEGGGVEYFCTPRGASIIAARAWTGCTTALCADTAAPSLQSAR